MLCFFQVEPFQDWLEQELSARGWGLADLAREGNINPSSLSRVLSGTRKAGPDLCTAIAHALRIPTEEVFRRAGLLPPTRVVEEEERLLFYYRGMPEEDRRRLLNIARAFYDATARIEDANR